MANLEKENVVAELSRELVVDEETARHILALAAGANATASKDDLVKEGILTAKSV